MTEGPQGDSSLAQLQGGSEHAAWAPLCWLRQRSPRQESLLEAALFFPVVWGSGSAASLTQTACDFKSFPCTIFRKENFFWKMVFPLKIVRLLVRFGAWHLMFAKCSAVISIG